MYANNLTDLSDNLVHITELEGVSYKL